MNIGLNSKPKPVPKRKEPRQPLKKTKTTMTNFDKVAFARARGPLCACGCQEPGRDAHHCLIPRIKDCPEVNDAWENLAYVNGFEHIQLRKFNTLEWRIFFWKQHCELYGYTHMIAWVRSLPLKVKQTRLDFLTPAEKAEVLQ